MPLVHCHFCKTPVDPDHHLTYRRTVGWERKAVAGSRRGGSDITLRSPLDEFACGFCIDAQKHGRSPSQAALL